MFILEKQLNYQLLFLIEKLGVEIKLWYKHTKFFSKEMKNCYIDKKITNTNCVLDFLITLCQNRIKSCVII